ncbi:hypothetical protein N2152v2_004014 [Parachlorella kessleri]
MSPADFICKSPLLASCGFDRRTVEAEQALWESLGSQVLRNLNLPVAEGLTDAQKRRVFQYYLPVFFWCRQQLLQHKSASSQGNAAAAAVPPLAAGAAADTNIGTEQSTTGPLILGISAPQGCGKTTLCEELKALFECCGYRAASISIDDFYLTHADQASVAAAHPDNPLLQQRGNAGSHDVQLGTSTLQALRQATTAGTRVPLPRYDKSAFEGQGDRADPSTWPHVEGPVDVVLFEGWMLGFAAVGAQAAAGVDPSLAAVDGFLERIGGSYREAWDSFVDAWLVVRVEDPQYAYKWRLQAEHAMRASGKPAMTDAQVQRFVDRFMPAYRCYLPGLYSQGPTTARPGHLLVVEVDGSRDPTGQQPDPLM